MQKHENFNVIKETMFFIRGPQPPGRLTAF